jgi:hypothetical protein
MSDEKRYCVACNHAAHDGVRCDECWNRMIRELDCGPCHQHPVAPRSSSTGTPAPRCQCVSINGIHAVDCPAAPPARDASEPAPLDLPPGVTLLFGEVGNPFTEAERHRQLGRSLLAALETANIDEGDSHHDLPRVLAMRVVHRGYYTEQTTENDATRALAAALRTVTG